MNRTPTDAEIEYAEAWMRSRGIAPFVLEYDRWFLPGRIPRLVWMAVERHEPWDTRSAAVAALALALAECKEACAVKGETT